MGHNLLTLVYWELFRKVVRKWESPLQTPSFLKACPLGHTVPIEDAQCEHGPMLPALGLS